MVRRIDGYSRERKLHVIIAFDDESLGSRVQPEGSNVSWSMFLLWFRGVLFDIFENRGGSVIKLSERKGRVWSRVVDNGLGRMSAKI